MLLALLMVLGGGAWYWNAGRASSRTERSDLIVEAVKRGTLEITVTERGNLESAANSPLICMVEGEQGTGILSIKEEGTLVKEGEVVVELDSSRLKDLAQQQEIIVEQAEAAMRQAEKNVEIQKTQNESDIAAAQLKFDLAILDLDKYQNGDLIQETNTIAGEIKLAQEDYARYSEKHGFTQRLIQKGYATQTELEADRIAKEKARIAMAVAEEKMKVLQDYTKRRMMAEKEANAKEFKRELKRVELKGEAALKQYEADVNAKTLTYKVEKDKYEKLQRQIALCTIKAPRDGLVVYANQRSGRGGNSQEAMIYEGAKVKERQAIINLPDVTHMQVNARVHESKIDQVQEGMSATVRVDAMPGELFHGEVSMVSLVPMSGNWPNINLKEYITYIKLTDDASKVSSLKPGLTAEVEILADRLEGVLQAPITAFVERGGRHFAWVLVNDKPQRREVKIGKSNEFATHVLEDESLYGKDQGLKEGDQVILSPRNKLPKEVALLEEEVPALATPSVKPGEQPAAGPRGSGGRRGGGASEEGRGGRTRGSPGETAGDDVGGGPDRGRRRGGGGAGRDPAETFGRLDTDKDGKLSEAELAQLPDRMKQSVTVTALDANKNNAIDLDEFVKHIEDMRQKFGAGGGGPPQGRPAGIGAGGGQ